MNDNDLIRNLEATAQKLTGRRVIIRIQEHHKALQGMVRKDTSGAAVMDLHPRLFLEPVQFARYFTHELAHVIKHFDKIPASRIEQPINDRLHTMYKRLKAGAVSKAWMDDEAEAERLADNWRNEINRYYQFYYRATGNPIMAILKILYHQTGSK